MAAAVVAGWFIAQPRPRVVSFKTDPAMARKPFAYDDYQAVLEAHVDGNGMVDYQTLKRNRQALDTFATALGVLPPAAYAG
jgi:hypothetical protein